ncbi:MAG: type II toxin-antitoxin system death-on-curing family toxin [Rhodospirillales bacterium]|nr:type II toxin-antitoxin system death-on-curing family toxin [Rhodospirillales bacterium]MSP80292.1 type II toxin-antitoxin system death-on-curing family toxin [Rhodospirillales bacterium]
MKLWVWIELSVVLALHEEHLAEHSGQPGVRDEGLLASALARPRNKESHDPDINAAALAAAYAFGIARNHPFVDGNKRTALAAAETFLGRNGFESTATDAECVTTFIALAAGEIGETALADWFQRNVRPKD